MNAHRLSQACAKTGLSERQIREYERQGLVEGVVRTAGLQRTYTDEQIERLRLIKKMRDAQLSLADIRLTLRVLGRSGLGIEAEGIRRVRAVLISIRSLLVIADEILSALEKRAARYDPPPAPITRSRVA